jgi:hypothetical protein
MVQERSQFDSKTECVYIELKNIEEAIRVTREKLVPILDQQEYPTCAEKDDIPQKAITSDFDKFIVNICNNLKGIRFTIDNIRERCVI